MNELCEYIADKLEDFWRRARLVLIEPAFQQWRRVSEVGGDSCSLLDRPYMQCNDCGAEIVGAHGNCTAGLRESGES